MFSLDVQRAICGNDMGIRCAAKCASDPLYICDTALQTVLHAALRTFSMYVFSVRFQCASKLHTQNAIFAASMPHILLHIQNAFYCSRLFAAHPNCTSKTQV
jgi:hypothetical protein